MVSESNRGCQLADWTAFSAKIREVLEEIDELVGRKDWRALRTAAVKLKYLEGIESAGAAWPERVHDH